MIPCKPIGQKLALLLFSLFVLAIHTISAQQTGEQIFKSMCASCHNVFKDGTGPALQGLESRHKWADHNELLKWIQNPPAYMANDAYTQGLKAQYGSVMQAFPAFTIEDVDAVVDYINNAKPPSAPTNDTTPGTETQSSGQNAIIFGVISLILAVIALILMQVNSNLKKMSDDKEGIGRPEPVPFYRNKVYIAMFAIIFFVIGGYYVTKGAIGLGRQKDYQPEQPIYYSHKVHAGINQINCLYCHGNAWESKHAAIPSVNVCMNCHKTVTEYTGPQLYDEEGNQINGTAEIQKLYKYAGFTPGPGATFDPAKAKPIPWVKIHNLPDHVFFSHAQHVRAGNVQCQTCHGEITAMDEVKQVSELSMGWCVNCHRETKVNFNYTDSTGNQFYSIYEKFHNELKTSELQSVTRDTNLTADVRRFRIDSIMKTRRMDSVTVMHIGGLECQKCHY